MLKCLEVYCSRNMIILPILFMMIVKIRVHYLITMIKSEVWPICHCVGSGHETMVCALYRSIFLLRFYLILLLVVRTAFGHNAPRSAHFKYQSNTLTIAYGLMGQTDADAFRDTDCHALENSVTSTETVRTWSRIYCVPSTQSIAKFHHILSAMLGESICSTDGYSI